MTVSDHPKAEQSIPYSLCLTPTVIAMKERIGVERLFPNKETVGEK
jgi:hypothetical protein